MKMKKTVSAIAALAMSVSAFAGLGISANAADVEEKDFIGSSTSVETFDNYDGQGWSSTVGTFNASASGNEHFGIINIDEIEKPNIGESIEAGIYPTYVSGNVFNTQIRGGKNAVSTYTFPSIVDSGKLYFETDVYTTNGDANPYAISFKFLDSEGNTVAYAEFDQATDSYLRLRNAAETQLNRTNDAMKYRSIDHTGMHFGLVFDLDNDNVSMTADYINTSGVRSTAMNSTNASNLTINDIAAFTISFLGHGGSHNYGCAIDNVKLYAEVLSNPAESLTVNYVSNGAPIADANVISLEGVSVNDLYTYYYPAYTTAADGTVYKSNSTEYGATRAIAAADDSVDVEYTALSSIAQFKDFDGTDPYAQDKASVSNGSVGAIGSSTWDAITVTQEGKYNITVNAVRVNNDSYRKGNVLVNGELVGTITYNGTVQTISNVNIGAGSVISISGNNSKSGLDYVLIEKVGDYTPIALAKPVDNSEPIEDTETNTTAALYEATVLGSSDKSYTQVKATAKTTSGQTATSTAPIDTTITTGGSVYATIVVEKIPSGDSIENVTIELL